MAQTSAPASLPRQGTVQSLTKVEQFATRARPPLRRLAAPSQAEAAPDQAPEGRKPADTVLVPLADCTEGVGLGLNTPNVITELTPRLANPNPNPNPDPNPNPNPNPNPSQALGEASAAAARAQVGGDRAGPAHGQVHRRGRPRRLHRDRRPVVLQHVRVGGVPLRALRVRLAWPSRQRRRLGSGLG